MKNRGYTRLAHPMVRKGGALVRTGWDEALDRAAEGFRLVMGPSATRAFGMFSCSKATNEVNFVAQKFARQVMGSHNIDSCNRT